MTKIYKIYGFIALLGLAFAFNTQASELSAETVEGATTVQAEQAFKLFEQGALFVDVRNIPSWEAGRIPGSVHLELKKVYSETSLGEEAAKDEPIVIYCNGPKCLRSADASGMAVKWGYNSVYYFRDGYPAWQAASYPTE